MESKQTERITRATITHPGDGFEREPVRRGKAGRRPIQIQRWVETCKARGLQTRQLVWDLVVVHGMSRTEAAERIGITRDHLYKLLAEEIANVHANEPSSAADFERRRTEMYYRLQAVHDAACPKLDDMDIDAETGAFVERNPDPRLLAIRLKALEQQARLYGINREAAVAGTGGGVQYATPDEIREAVERRALELHGRADDIEAIKSAQVSNLAERVAERHLSDI